MPPSSRLACAIVVGLATAPSTVLAGTLNYTLYAGVEHSNNIALSSDNPVSENVLTPGGTFQFTQMGSTFQANVAGTVEYRKYLQNHFDSQLQTQLAGQGNWTIMPDRLDFSVEDYAGVQPVDQLASNSPDNQQQTNVLVAGPTLRMRFGQSARGQFELRYINSYASKVDDFDSSRGLAAFRVFRDLSPTDTVSANVEFQRVNFSNQQSSADYDRKEAFVRYTSNLAHFDADVLVGGSRLEFDGGERHSAPLVRLRLGWQPTLRNSLTVSGAYQYADAAQDIITTPGAFGVGLSADRTESIDPFAGTGGLGSGLGVGTGIGTGSAVIGSQVYKERRLDATWNWRGERLTVTASPAYSKLRYVDDPTFDQNDRGLSVGIGYRLRPTVTLSGFATLDKLKYETVDRNDTTVRLGLNLSRQWNQHWSGQVSVARERRTSNAIGQDYKATSFFIGVVYRR
ncbi:outer membrane beta-barrel protein [Luteibacter jiangsuensis]|uniref:Outer membrane beta-barrel protein n=1 Tax=Luteibacter jiangsuensis TaxID=637577 RepID=A0ABX0Q0A7_9GAMM|nr:outer membrane beta-barrel protein [Luteibacter jiangsuensis]NID03455.1 outer membrane beta-barrel protein [Luteibacter jiangsuensis]